jgi:hypothetical protein
LPTCRFRPIADLDALVLEWQQWNAYLPFKLAPMAGLQDLIVCQLAVFPAGLSRVAEDVENTHINHRSALNRLGELVQADGLRA